MPAVRYVPFGNEGYTKHTKHINNRDKKWGSEIMKTIVIYKSKYGSTKAYGQWIADALDCKLIEAKEATIPTLLEYDTIIYGGGLYAEKISGLYFITKNYDKLKSKNIIVYTTGITPLDCREYYDEMVLKKNLKPDMIGKIKVYNYLGKMVIDELSMVHKGAIKTLKKLMAGKENPTKMEKMLIDLCDVDADLTDKNAISDLVEYVKALQ